ncbi:hypothetical protein HMPREF1548_04954 [Clostridium sp. KLE 1755]|nr:hypothetical protein HMPREF1548_04954 [Clostridium sp. KLE 1755]
MLSEFREEAGRKAEREYVAEPAMLKKAPEAEKSVPSTAHRRTAVQEHIPNQQEK